MAFPKTIQVLLSVTSTTVASIIATFVPFVSHAGNAIYRLVMFLFEDDDG
jgi:hypothetical protein